MADLLVCPGIGVFDKQQLAGGGRVSGPERCGSRYLISIFSLPYDGCRDRLGLLTAYIRRTIQEKRLIVYDVSEEDKREVTVPLVFCLFWGLCGFLLIYPF